MADIDFKILGQQIIALAVEAGKDLGVSFKNDLSDAEGFAMEQAVFLAQAAANNEPGLDIGLKTSAKTLFLHATGAAYDAAKETDVKVHNAMLRALSLVATAFGGPAGAAAVNALGTIT